MTTSSHALATGRTGQARPPHGPSLWGKSTTQFEGILGSVPSDTELLYAWHEGDTRAGGQLCERYFDSVRRFFANKVTGDPSDLVQDTFATCVKTRNRIETGHFRPFLFGVAYKVFQRYLRKKYRLPEENLASHSMHDIAPGPSTMLQESEDNRRLLMALRQLPVELQVALELTFWEDMPSHEVAPVLGIPASTVRSHLRRSKILLKKALEDLGPPKEDE